MEMPPRSDKGTWKVAAIVETEEGGRASDPSKRLTTEELRRQLRIDPEKKTVTLSGGYYDQYLRMKRSYRRLADYGSGRVLASSDEALDALYHFLQDAYHLKDWIANDPIPQEEGVHGQDVEDFITDSENLSLCADLCNGTKHFVLDEKRRRPRTGDPLTTIVSQHTAVFPAPIGAGDPWRPPQHAWEIVSGGRTHDAVYLAGQIVREWSNWLLSNGLITQVDADYLMEPDAEE